MICKPRSCRGNAGTTLVEIMIATLVGMMVLVAVASFALFSSRTFVSYSANTGLDTLNRRTMDQLTRDIRSVAGVTSFSSNSVSFTDWDGSALSYNYNLTNRTLVRIKSGSTNVLLKDCNRLSFEMGKRVLTNGTYGIYPSTNTLETKAVTVRWCCFRKILGAVSDDMPQYATVVIRSK
jgi:Tfp pilus assembly protein PilW